MGSISTEQIEAIAFDVKLLLVDPVIRNAFEDGVANYLESDQNLDDAPIPTLPVPASESQKFVVLAAFYDSVYSSPEFDTPFRFAEAPQVELVLPEARNVHQTFERDTVKRLQEMAKEMGITGFSNKRKADLLQMLKDAVHQLAKTSPAINISQTIRYGIWKCYFVGRVAQIPDEYYETICGYVRDFKAKYTIQVFDEGRSVIAFGESYTFAKDAAKCFMVLYEHYKQGGAGLSGEYIRKKAKVGKGRIVDLFDNSPAWGTLIRQVPGTGKRGVYWLVPPDK